MWVKYISLKVMGSREEDDKALSVFFYSYMIGSLLALLRILGFSFLFFLA